MHATKNIKSENMYWAVSPCKYLHISPGFDQCLSIMGLSLMCSLVLVKCGAKLYGIKKWPCPL